MGFIFNISKEDVVRSASQYLKPWDIYKVKFDGCELTEGAYKNDPSKSWKAINITFKGESGMFKKMLFIPDVNNENDTKQPEYSSSNGGTIKYPSACDEFMGIIGQIVYVLNPEGFEKLQAMLPKFKTMDDVTTAFMKLMEKCVGQETCIKLIGKKSQDGRVNADFPRVKKISSKGEMYTANNIIGDKLFFSDYEEGERQKYLNAKPSNVEQKDPIADVAGIDSSSSEFDLDSLL